MVNSFNLRYIPGKIPIAGARSRRSAAMGPIRLLFEHRLPHTQYA